MPSKVYIEFGELPSKYKKAVSSIIRELGFSMKEISELVIMITPPPDDTAGFEKKESNLPEA